MIIIRNPARARPLSRNVKRLMREARASPLNPDVIKSGRELTEKDLAFCDLQGCIFMCAVDRGLSMELFAPLFMTSQLSSLIDYSFFHPGCQSSPEVEYLKIPLLLKSPELIVDVLLWIEGIVANKESDETARAALVKALAKESDSGSAEAGEWGDGEYAAGEHIVVAQAAEDCGSDEAGEQVDNDQFADGSGSDEAGEQTDDDQAVPDSERISLAPALITVNDDVEIRDIDALVAQYEYAYLLGYIYRYESILHEEASRMVYAVLDESFMRETFDQMDLEDVNLADCAGEICRRLDQLIVSNL